MEKSVNGIRETYFRDMIGNYDDCKEESFLYRAFWTEGVKDMLKKYLPPLPDRRGFTRWMKELNRQFLEPLADEANGPEQITESFAGLSGEAKDLLEVHLPQLPESVVSLLKKHFLRLPGEVKGILQENFPWLLEKEILWWKYEKKIGELLQKMIRERPEWAKKELLQRPPQKISRTKAGQQEEAQGGQQEEGKGERRDFWAELWLNDAGYKTGLITDTEYYLWLVEYLAARGVYYKDTSIQDAHVGLYRLLMRGLGMKPEMFRVNGRNVCSKMDAEKYLGNLAEKIRKPQAGLTEEERSVQEAERGAIAGRLHNLTLKYRRKDRPGEPPREEDYLLWLTGRLKRMTVHIRLKTWLQDNGHPLVRERNVKGQPKEGRKQDFSMRLFETFCDSEDGYDFYRKKDGLRVDGAWSVNDGFCAWRPDGFETHLQTLLRVLEQEGRENFYFPLAIDLHSGCVFFLAGKGYYEDTYEGEEDDGLKETYEKTDALFCFDYLRLDGEEPFGDYRVTFRLFPAFHEHAGKSYREVFEDFKKYCKYGDRQQKIVSVADGDDEYYCEDVTVIPREKIRSLNEEGPIGIPEIFGWAFDGMMEKAQKPSRMARADQERVRNKISRERLYTGSKTSGGFA